MKRLLLGAAFALAGGSAVLAADLPAAPAYKAPILAPIPVYNWTGWYIGLNAGGARGKFDATTTTVFSPTGYFATTSVPAIATAGAQRINSTGFTGGGQLGYNLQTGMIVVGAEVDFEAFHLSGSASSTALYPCCAPTNFTIRSSATTDWLFTARPRLGIANNNWLFYVTGGLALTNLNANFQFSDTFATAAESASLSKTKAGWTAGGGVEVGVGADWTIRAEYLYLDFGSITGTSTNLTAFTPPIAFPTNVFTHSINLKASLARFAINHRF